MAINYSTKAIPFVAECERNMFVLMNGNTQFNPKKKGGDGTTTEVLIPGFGEVGTGADMSSTNRTYANGVKTVTMTQYHKGVDLTTVEESFELSSFEDQIAVPYGEQMASEMQKKGVNEILLNASTTVIGSSTGDYKDMGTCLANIKSARAKGAMFFALNPDLSNQVQNSSLNFFQPSLTKSFFEGELGKFRGAQGAETPDIESLDTGSHVVTGALTVKTAVVNGATSLVLEAASSITGTFLKGEIVTLAGVKATDVYGNAIKSDYSFIANADGVVSGGDTLTIPVKAVYTSDPTLVNVAGTGIVTNAIPIGTVATIKTDASSTYLRGIFWNKQAFITASIALDSLISSKRVGVAVGKSIQITGQADSDIKTGQNIYRWDALKGFLLGRDNWCSVYLIKA